MHRQNFVAAMMAAGLAAAAFAGAASAADAKKGETVFQRCAICHADTKGRGNRVGPDLWGIVGRKAGTAENFFYSPALKNSGIVWTNEKLEAYVMKPSAAVPGNRMAFGGIADKAQADDLIAYLDTLK
jgi:cytochrome c